MLQRGLVAMCVLACAGLVFADKGDTAQAHEHEQIVQRFVAAFNAHDVDAMLELVSDDIQWLSINGKEVGEEAAGKAQLRSGMTGYFASCSSCQSRLEKVFSTGARVSALEIASYETSDGVQEQQSLSVYEFSGQLISRVYYFPAEQ